MIRLVCLRVRMGVCVCLRACVPAESTRAEYREKYCLKVDRFVVISTVHQLFGMEFMQASRSRAEREREIERDYKPECGPRC